MTEPFVFLDDEKVFFVHDCNAMCGDGKRRQINDRIYELDSRWAWDQISKSTTPSVHCMACGVHGFWTNGVWVAIVPKEE